MITCYAMQFNKLAPDLPFSTIRARSYCLAASTSVSNTPKDTCTEAGIVV